MTLPNRCRVKDCERRQSGSRRALAAGEIRSAKSDSVGGAFAKDCWTLAVVAPSDLLRSVSSGSELNSATKLTAVRYQNRRQQQAGVCSPSSGLRTAPAATATRGVLTLP